jgi:cobalamin biosynthesis protein CobD/CbiB
MLAQKAAAPEKESKQAKQPIAALAKAAKVKEEQERIQQEREARKKAMEKERADQKREAAARSKQFAEKGAFRCTMHNASSACFRILMMI